MEALARIERARSRLILDNPFYGCLALHLGKPELHPAVDTMATDGHKLFYCPAAVDGWSDAELLFVVAHEVKHCAYAHMSRIGGRDLGRFNRAADYAINSDLIREAIGTAPQGVLVDSRFDGMGAEEIYAILAREDAAKPQNPPQQGQGNGQGQPSPSHGQGSSSQGQGKPQGGNGAPQAGNAPGKPSQGQGAASQGQAGQPGADASPHGIGGIMQPGDGGEAAAAEMAAKWQVATRQAASVAKARNAGTMPGFAERALAELSAPRVDWRATLADLINSRAVVDYSFSRPNRHFMGRGMYLPGQVRDAIGCLVFAVDTSGSVTADMVQNAASEIVGAMEEGKVARLVVIYADSKVQRVQEFERGDAIELAPLGGGGTKFSPVFERVAAEHPDADAVIYLTDLVCNDWGSEPECPVFWAVHGSVRSFENLSRKVPFGSCIHLGQLD